MKKHKNIFSKISKVFFCPKIVNSCKLAKNIIFIKTKKFNFFSDFFGGSWGRLEGLLRGSWGHLGAALGSFGGGRNVSWGSLGRS